MKRFISTSTNLISFFSVLVLVLGMTYNSYAHCDRENGPVALAAKKALETGDPANALIWVGDQQAEELKSTFRQSLEVYKKGGDSRELAERYFMETTVRLHREAEGMPYTGLKPAQPNSEDIQMAEKTLDSGNLSPVMKLLSKELEAKGSELFSEAIEAQKHKNEGIEAGRQWVDAYVKYIIYVHGLYEAIQAGPAHGVGE